MSNKERLVLRSAGSYLKVIQFSGTGGDAKVPPVFLHMSAHNDAHLISYLLPSGVFLQVGHWRGYELTVAAGKWDETRDRVMMRGVGRILSLDVAGSNSSARVYERNYVREAVAYTTTLTAESDMEEWSLLGWQGPLVYVGSSFFMEARDDRLPSSWQEIGPWVQRFLESSPVSEADRGDAARGSLE